MIKPEGQIKSQPEQVFGNTAHLPVLGRRLINFLHSKVNAEISSTNEQKHRMGSEI